MARLQDFQVERPLLEHSTCRYSIGATNFTEHSSRGQSLLGHCLAGSAQEKGKIQEWNFPVWEARGISWLKSMATALRKQPETDGRAGETREGKTYSFPPWLGEPSGRHILHGWDYTTPVENCEAKQSWQLKSDTFTRLNWTLQLPPFIPRIPLSGHKNTVRLPKISWSKV